MSNTNNENEFVDPIDNTNTSDNINEVDADEIELDSEINESNSTPKVNLFARIINSIKTKREQSNIKFLSWYNKYMLDSINNGLDNIEKLLEEYDQDMNGQVSFDEDGNMISLETGLIINNPEEPDDDDMSDEQTDYILNSVLEPDEDGELAPSESETLMDSFMNEPVEGAEPHDESVKDADTISTENISDDTKEETSAASEVENDAEPLRIKYEIPLLGNFARALCNLKARTFEEISEIIINQIKLNGGKVEVTGDPYKLNSDGSTVGCISGNIGKYSILSSQVETVIGGKKYRYVSVFLNDVSLLFVPKYDKKLLALNYIGIPTDSIEKCEKRKGSESFVLKDRPYDVRVMTNTSSIKNSTKINAIIEFAFATEI